MIIWYEFGGDDDHPGEDYEFEVDYDMRVEAIADYFADNYIHHVVQKTKPSQEQVKKLRASKKVLVDVITTTLSDFDLVTDELEEDLRDTIKEYWEDQALEDWSNAN